ncbi:MAG: efflux RND transporter permease subunit, partial [Rickettsiales bacterium]|nr:efflux RND transporter permease subunit [Rickettsiales bacterium]
LQGMQEIGGFVDVEDSRPIPAIEWEMAVDRAQAARFDVNMQIIGNFIKLVTNGLRVTTYRPDESDDEVDIMLRFPENRRGLDQLDRLRVVTEDGAVPISNFVTRTPVQKISRIDRTDLMRVMTIRADVEKGVLVDDKVQAFKTWLHDHPLPEGVFLRFKGEDEEQQEAANFLQGAFMLALASMALVLLFQFNRVYQMLIIMSAVFLSTVGVLLGLLVTQQPFGIVMCGVGVISLAGIVVNNNIIFIDTYNTLRARGMAVRDALIQTGTLRLRPILLTAGTTVLGLIPMVTTMNINFISREVTFGAPSTQWWQQLSTSIAGGLTFATILTLFFTPALITLAERWFARTSDPVKKVSKRHYSLYKKET